MRLVFPNLLGRSPLSPSASASVSDNTVSDRIASDMASRQAVVMLGGGGARGIAHLGAIDSMVRQRLNIQRIVGVSMGSLVGGLFASTPRIKSIEAKAVEFLTSPEFSRQYQTLLGTAPQLNPRGNVDRPEQSDWYGWVQRLIMTSQQIYKLFQQTAFAANDFLRFAVEELIPDIDIQDTEIPLTVLAADLHGGLPVALESGSLREAILASSSIPGFFPPIRWGDLLLCDLGTVNSLPIEIARSYATDLTIGVDVAGAIQRVGEFNHAVDIMIRMDEIGERMSRRQSHKHGEIIIRPEVQHRSWYDFRDPEKLIRAGRVAADQRLRRGVGHIA